MSNQGCPFSLAWDDALSEELGHHAGASAAAVALDGASSAAQAPQMRLNPSARPKGRPRGVSKMMQERLQQEHLQRDSDEEAARPGPANMHLVRAMRTVKPQGDLCVTQQCEAMASSFGPMSFLMSVGSMLQRTLGSALLAARRRWPAKNVAQPDAEDSSDKMVSHILQGDILTCSSSAVSKLLGSTRTCVQRSLLAAAAATLEGAGLLWGTMLTSLGKVQTATANTRPLMFCVHLKFDETPTKVRVATLDAESGGADSSSLNVHGQHILVPRAASAGQNLQRFLQLQKIAPKLVSQSATHAKVLQTQLQLGVLYQTIAPDGEKSHAWVKGAVPCSLQAMDRSTGEAQLSCVMENLAIVPELKRLSSDFPLQLRVTTTDRYGANARTEEGLRREYPSFLSTHLACDIHRCSTCIGNMLKSETCEADISGLLNTALSLSELGSVKKLRGALTTILFEEMDVQYSPPPEEATKEYRENVYNLYLPVSAVTRPVEKNQPQAPLETEGSAEWLHHEPMR